MKQERYEQLYDEVSEEMISKGYITDTLMELCAMSVDPESDIVNIELLLTAPRSSLRELKKTLDVFAPAHGFTPKYLNLTGDL